MSHHLDSPVARQDIRLDITDLYLFRGEVGTVFVINVCHSIAGEIPAPGYHPEGMYEFKIDLNRDAVEELTYRLTSTHATLRASSATFCGALPVHRPPTRMRPARWSLRGPPAKR